MSEASGEMVIGASVLSAAGGYIVKWLFTRNIEGSDKAQEEIRLNVKEVLVQLKSLSDEQIRLRADITGLVKDSAQQSQAIRAAHDRIDALVSPTPNVRRRKR